MWRGRFELPFVRWQRTVLALERPPQVHFKSTTFVFCNVRSGPPHVGHFSGRCGPQFPPQPPLTTPFLSTRSGHTYVVHTSIVLLEDLAGVEPACSDLSLLRFYWYSHFISSGAVLGASGFHRRVHHLLFTEARNRAVWQPPPCLGNKAHGAPDVILKPGHLRLRRGPRIRRRYRL